MFLTIVTRTHCRPFLFARSRASLYTLTDPDFEHVIVDDQVGLGIKGSHQAVIDVKHKFRGRYVWLLDDDDWLIEPMFIEQLKAVTEDNPPVIFCRLQHNRLGILPDDLHWTLDRPVFAQLGFPCLVVRTDMWLDTCAAMTTVETGGDYALAAELFTRFPFRKLDLVAAYIPQKRDGMPEERYAQCKSVLDDIKQLWVPGQQVLYVGASHLFPPAFNWELSQARHNITLLEIWPDNVQYFEAHGNTFNHIIHGDVRDVDLDEYDIVFWWHGPEHVKPKEVKPTLARLEAVANLIVFACPFGWRRQEALPNPYQDHLCALYPEMFDEYSVRTIGERDKLNAQMIAWK